MLPPVLVRRLRAGAGDAGCSRPLAVTGLPVLLLVAVALATILPGRWRALRLLWMVLLYLLLESVALVALFGLWVASGFGWRIRSPRFQRAHYVLVQWFLQILFWECQRVLHVRVAVEGPTADVVRREAAADPEPARRPGRLVPRRARAAELVRAGAADRAQGHPAVGPRDRRAC